MPQLSKAILPRSTLLAVTVSFATLIAGCSGGSDVSPSEPGGSAAPPAEVTVPVSAVTVELLQPGAEPRERITLRPAAGTSQHVTLTTSAQVFQQIDDQPAQDFSSPEITLPLTAQVSQTVEDAATGFTVDLILGDITTPDATLGSALEASKGSGAGFTVSESGAVTALRLRPSPEAQNLARSAIEQAFYQAVYRTVAFPEAPVGLGAQWIVRQQVMSGIALEQTTTATIAARDGNRVTVDFTIDQKPLDPVWPLPGDAGTLNVDQYAMTGSGSMTLDLALPLPVGGVITVGGDQAYSDPEGTTRLRQTTANRVQWGGR